MTLVSAKVQLVIVNGKAEKLAENSEYTEYFKIFYQPNIPFKNPTDQIVLIHARIPFKLFTCCKFILFQLEGA